MKLEPKRYPTATPAEGWKFEGYHSSLHADLYQKDNKIMIVFSANGGGDIEVFSIDDDPIFAERHIVGVERRAAR